MSQRAPDTLCIQFMVVFILKFTVSTFPQKTVQHSANPDQFLALFPHRFDYIWAEHSNPGEKPQWRTESRHPLSDRLIGQGAYLYGVRFGTQTQYCVLDIDAGSPYHPERDPFAISRMVAALEGLGMVSYVACTSSYSNGLHLYFPFEQSQSSWKLAIAVSTSLQNSGFKVRPGQLEVFPDPKPYSVDGKPTLFNAHRLPLQMGSYVVDQDFQPIWSSQESFVRQWKFAQTQNRVQPKALDQILKQVKRECYRVSTKAEKFVNDLNAEIELGWTGYGQTNYLLGRITMREYIFRHILTGGKPLEGTALVEAIVNIAQALPGYAQWCRHQHEIHHRAEEWAQCIENSHYFHYGDAAGKFKAKSSNPDPKDSELETAIAQTPSWNQQQSTGARERIRGAIAALLEQSRLPANATARFHALVSYGIGGGTLYRHRDLWHPNYLTLDVVEIPPHPPTTNAEEWDCCEAASHSQPLTSLFLPDGGNAAPVSSSDDSLICPTEEGRNTEQSTLPKKRTAHHLSAIQAAQRAAIQIASRQQQQIKQQAGHARQVARMQQFLDSGDPILVAEAIAWAQANPDVLVERREGIGD